MRHLLARAKPVLAGAASSVGLFHIATRLVGRGAMRVLNYHTTPGRHAASFEAQLMLFARHFTPGGPRDLDDCLAGRFHARRPGLLITFDDGYRSNYDIAAPLLERYGFRGFFFLPSSWIDETRAEADAQFERVKACERGPSGPHDARYLEPSMSWEEARDLQRRGHVIGCHTRTHMRLGDELTAEQLHEEIVVARQEMEQHLGAPVDDFCWVGGEEWSYGKGAFDTIMSQGFKRIFMTNFSPVDRATPPWWIQRASVEASLPLAQVKFQLSGLMDVAYRPKRNRLARKLLTTPVAGLAGNNKAALPTS